MAEAQDRPDPKRDAQGERDTRREQIDARMREAFERMEEAKRKNEQFGFDLPPEAEEDADARIAEALLADEPSRDPRYKGVYSVLRILKEHLPPGDEHEEGRAAIRKEIRCYLNQGKEAPPGGIVGADMRQADLPRLKVALAILRKWVREGANASDLYCEFLDLNRKLGYRSK